MKRHLLRSLLIAGLAASSHSVLKAADPSYADLVKRAAEGDLTVDFKALRLGCAATKGCNPRGEDFDRYSMRQAMAQMQYEKALDFARKLISIGFVNIEAHNISARAYQSLNMPDQAKMERDLTNALLRSITNSGDGKSKATAYRVITEDEEYFALAALKLPLPISQSLVEDKQHAYDVLSVEDPDTGREISVYFNVDAFYGKK